MHSKIKILRSGDRITLLSRNGGKAMAWLLLLEVVLLVGIMGHLASVLPSSDSLLLPVLASLALMGWTATQIRSDVRITMDLASREGRIVREAPLLGARTTATFTIDEVESLSLWQTLSRGLARTPWKEYVVAVELRDGERHVLSARGPLLAYQEDVARFSNAAGLGTRIVRLQA